MGARQVRANLAPRSAAWGNGRGVMGDPPAVRNRASCYQPVRETPNSAQLSFDYTDPPGAQRVRVASASYQQGFKVGTLNVSSLLKATLHHQLEEYMKSKSLQPLALTETNSPGTTKYMVGGLLYLLSSDRASGEREYAGVGVALGRKAQGRLTQ
eukprot:8674398-Alexandrium_andersonii.AAC.1